jgi:hypothetical protein
MKGIRTKNFDLQISRSVLENTLRLAVTTSTCVYTGLVHADSLKITTEDDKIVINTTEVNGNTLEEKRIELHF